MFRTIIVEPSTSLRRVLRDTLRAHFPLMDVVQAKDRHQVLSKIAAAQPDLVFLDIRLPGGHGLELIARVRAACARARIVVLGSHDLPEYRQAALSQGADYYLSNASCTPDDIVGLAESALPAAGVAWVRPAEGQRYPRPAATTAVRH
jgi:DNA-binding NarL/FixJ family response regulator